VFEFAIVVLFALAISDLIVGVSNDAVNFLNSSIGSRVAPRTVIMVIASLGMLAGVTFASGMMEVARISYRVSSRGWRCRKLVRYAG